MADAPNPKHLDKRTTERYLRSGQLDEGSYKEHLEKLPDVADKATVVETVMNDDIFDDEEEDDEDLEDEPEDEDEDSKSAE